jgi:2',3'-cyclic-nucleotide 2'-phosphodiesterase (5'-nucleotidase family)
VRVGGNLSTTQISSSTITTLSTGNPLPTSTLIGAGGRIPPTENIDDDAFAIFDPVNDGIDFFESLEGMLVTAQDLVAVSGTNRFGEIFAVVDNGVGATGISQRGTLNIGPDDFNPEKIQIDEDTGIFDFAFPNVNTGDSLGNVTGVVSYSFGNFEILPTQDFTSNIQSAGLQADSTIITGAVDKLTVATYNVLNLDPNDSDGDTDIADGRFTTIAQQIVNNLNTPDIIGLQEIQDNSGSLDDGTISASQTLQMLVDAIAAAGGPQYEFIDNPFITNNLSGGQPGANIRTAYLYNPNRVSLVNGSVQTIGSQNPGDTFNGARLPLVASFDFNGQEVTVVDNHFSSKGGSAPILGVNQDFAARQEDITVNGSLDERREQAQAVNNYVDEVLANNANANVVVLGDLNEFEFVSPLQILEGTLESANGGQNTTTGGNAVLTNLINNIAEDERYSFNFQGNSQQLDHVLVSNGLLTGAEVDIVHVNSEFAETNSRASDHDPVVVGLNLPNHSPQEPFRLQLFHAADQEAGISALDDAPRFSAVLNALRQQDLDGDGVLGFENTLTLSSGDAYIGGLFFDASEEVFGARGRGDILIQNELGFQAIAFGNHEFDFGTEVVKDLISPNEDDDYEGALFPYLSANIDFSNDHNLAGLVVADGQEANTIPNAIASNTVITLPEGEKIGVVGAVTPTLPNLTSTGGVDVFPSLPWNPSNPGDLDALAAIIQTSVDELLSNNPGMNKVVLLAHMQQIDVELALAERLSNVDIIVAGGSNTRLFDENDRARSGDSSQGDYPQFRTDIDGNSVAVVNTDGNYKYVGRLVLDFDANGHIIPESYDPNISGAYATDEQGVIDVGGQGLEDPEIVAITDALRGVIESQESNVLVLVASFSTETAVEEVQTVFVTKKLI